MNNSMWQACPVCNGQGNNLLGRPCHVCNGHGIISTISGLPPVHRKYNTTTSSTTTSILSVSSSGTDTIYGLGVMTTATTASVLGNGVYYGRLVCVNKTTAPYNWAYFP
jgi:RecJ-like exonuclease